MDLAAVMTSASSSDLAQELNSLLVIAAIAAATPLLVGLLRLPVAEVVLMLQGLVFIVVVLPLLWHQLITLFNELPGMLAKWQSLLLLLPERYPHLVSDEQVLQAIEAARGEIGKLTAQIAELRGKIAEVELKRLQILPDAETSAAQELAKLRPERTRFLERRASILDGLTTTAKIPCQIQIIWHFKWRRSPIQRLARSSDFIGAQG